MQEELIKYLANKCLINNFKNIENIYDKLNLHM